MRDKWEERITRENECRGKWKTNERRGRCERGVREKNNEREKMKTNVVKGRGKGTWIESNETEEKDREMEKITNTGNYWWHILMKWN